MNILYPVHVQISLILKKQMSFHSLLKECTHILYLVVLLQEEITIPLSNLMPFICSETGWKQGGLSSRKSHYSVQSRSLQYQHSGSGPVPVLDLLRTRPPQQEVSCRPVNEVSSVLQLLSITLSSPPEGTVQLVFLELFVVTLPMLNRNKNSTNIDDYFSFSVLRMVSQCPSSLSQ